MHRKDKVYHLAFWGWGGVFYLLFIYCDLWNHDKQTLSSYGNNKMRIYHIRLIKRKSSLLQRPRSTPPVPRKMIVWWTRNCGIVQGWSISLLPIRAMTDLSAAPKSAQSKYGIVTCQPRFQHPTMHFCLYLESISLHIQ